MPRPYVVGLTGGIASGKSTIAAMLAAELDGSGGALLECDKLGWRAYDPTDGAASAATRDALEAAFKGDAKGGTLLAADGTVDRTKLGPIVFSAKEKMDALNAIVWPAIAALAEAELAEMGESGTKVVIMEAAVLLEAGWDVWVDEVWVVNCPREKQRTRLCDRQKGLSEADADKRLNSQMSLEDRLAKVKGSFCPVHVVIDNSGSLANATTGSSTACAALLKRLEDHHDRTLAEGTGAKRAMPSCGCSWLVILGGVAVAGLFSAFSASK